MDDQRDTSHMDLRGVGYCNGERHVTNSGSVHHRGGGAWTMSGRGTGWAGWGTTGWTRIFQARGGRCRRSATRARAATSRSTAPPTPTFPRRPPSATVCKKLALQIIMELPRFSTHASTESYECTPCQYKASMMQCPRILLSTCLHCKASEALQRFCLTRTQKYPAGRVVCHPATSCMCTGCTKAFPTCHPTTYCLLSFCCNLGNDHVLYQVKSTIAGAKNRMIS